MRRLFGYFFMLLLVGAVFLIFLARGPGLKSLPVPVNFEPLMGVLAEHLDPGDGPQPQLPSPAPATPVTHQPTTVPLPPTASPKPESLVLTVSVHGPAGEALDAVIDGNTVALTALVANSTEVAVTGTVSFSLEPSDAGSVPFASCRIHVEPGSQASCTARTAADGWAWQAHQPVKRRTVHATFRSSAQLIETLTGHEVAATVEVPVRPKPVVLVHGFTSNAATWSAWTGADGFLARWGIAGYAVGDDQFNIEPMDTGVFAQPRRPTHSIAENAAILARYVDAVRRATGAERVDLVAHSMGGLISRYYVSQLMPLVERQELPAVPAVNQLYMIGTPNAGTPCAIPPATLGLYPPATTQLTPSYVQRLFNPQTSDVQGVPFFVLAGDPVRDFAALVCTPVPTDVYVSVASAGGAVPVVLETIPVRHGEQTKSPAVFAAVLRSLSRDPQDYPIPMPIAPALAPMDTAGLQVSLVDSGTLSPDRPATVSVTVDEAEQASFLLYAPGQDVEMSILSNIGRPITSETAQSTPDVSVATADGRGTTATQGFKIEKPKAGQWQLILMPRAGAQTDGGFYVVAAFLQSDLRLAVETPSPAVPAGQPVAMRATLSGPVALETTTATATIRDARGEVVGEVTLLDDGAHEDGQAGDGVFGGVWTPAGAGLYSVAVTASGQNLAGNPFQRLAVLAVEIL
ncbi:MAG: esterase/lipase family protein [Anaerolineae bacterium]